MILAQNRSTPLTQSAQTVKFLAQVTAGSQALLHIAFLRMFRTFRIRNVLILESDQLCCAIGSLVFDVAALVKRLDNVALVDPSRSSTMSDNDSLSLSELM